MLLHLLGVLKQLISYISFIGSVLDIIFVNETWFVMDDACLIVIYEFYNPSVTLMIYEGLVYAKVF
jgi:hypothetical protein